MPLLPISLQSAYDQAGNRVLGARLRVYAAGGTTQPVKVYLDADFSTLHPDPVPARGNGTWPALFVPSGSYRLYIVDSDGLVLDDVDDLTLTTGGGGGGGGGGDPSDATAVFQTGDLKDRYGAGPHPGWARCTGRTIGSVNSGATERANADCQALHAHLWNTDPNLVVAGGRGASAEADWLADKPIALPDHRARFRVALDGMGNVASNRLAGALFAFGTPGALGSYGGEATHTLTLAQMPAHVHVANASSGLAGSHDHGITVSPVGTHDHSGSSVQNGGAHTHSATSSTTGSHTHDVRYQFAGSGYEGGGNLGATQTVGETGSNGLGSTLSDGGHNHSITVNSGGSSHDHGLIIAGDGAHTHSATCSPSGSHTHPITVSVGSAGSGVAFNQAPPFLLVSTYIKL